MSTQHTPGPLGPLSVSTVQTSCGICHKIGPLPKRQSEDRDNFACVYVDYPGGGSFDDDMLRAARIFAAAPDMHEALKSMRAYLSKCPPHSEDRTGAEWGRMMDMSGAALARAEGKS